MKMKYITDPRDWREVEGIKPKKAKDESEIEIEDEEEEEISPFSARDGKILMFVSLLLIIAVLVWAFVLEAPGIAK